MKILTLEEIKKCLDLQNIIALQEEGFKALSQGKFVLPPVGYLPLKDPPGSFHVKYGCLEGDPAWGLKIAGGPDHLPLNGLILLLSTKTGELEGVLLDNGYLTQLRTAVAGLIAAKCLAPKNVPAIGVLGTGVQSRLQAELLASFSKTLYVWGRSPEGQYRYKEDMEKKGFEVHTTSSAQEVAQNCNLLITTTASSAPLLRHDDIQKGTHITAIGADAPGKMELDPQIIAQAHIVAVDSKSQCLDHGEVRQAYEERKITEHQLIELGEILLFPHLGRTREDQLTVADLTGVAVQDIQIAKAVLKKSEELLGCL